MQRPNLVYVFADQLRYDACGYTGDARAQTPRIDALARESVSFPNAVSVSPMCAPYRASLFTGTYSSSTGMAINEIRTRPDPDAIGHVLGRAGYDTGYIGKWHLYGRDHSEQEQFCPPGPDRLGFDGYWASFNFHHEYNSAFYYHDTPERIAVEGYEPDVQTDLALAYLERARSGSAPFAMFLSYGTPHDPWEGWNCPEDDARRFADVAFPDPPNYADGSAEYWSRSMTREWWLERWKPHREQYRRIYYAMTANLDRNLGRLLDGLDRMGLAEDTIVVFTSDHGEMFGAHGRIAKNIFYEEACRVPFLLRWPGRVPAGSTSDACLNTPDIMPTLLSLLGLPVPAPVEGMDLSAAVRGERGPEPAAALMQGMGHTWQWIDGFEWRALRDKRHTYAVMRERGDEFLFDNIDDPYQMRNLIDDPAHAATRETLRQLLADEMTRLDDPFERCTWYRDHWVDDGRIVRGHGTPV